MGYDLSSLPRVLAGLVGLSIGLSGTSPAVAQTATGDAGAEILSEGRLVKLEDMDFGVITPGTSRGFVTIAPGGAISTTNGIVVTGATQPARFRARRRVFRDYPDYVGPGNNSIVWLTNPAAPGRPMRLSNFTTDFSVFGYFFTSEYIFHVGGRLRIDPDQPSGVYTGTFNVTVDYN